MTKINYKKNFLKEVILRVDFLSEISEIQKQLPRDISNALKVQFPIPETRETIKTELNFTKQKQDIRKVDEFTEWSFHTKDRMKSITIQKLAIFLKVSKYDSYEKLKAEFMTGISALFDTYEQVQAKRLGLRYINEIKINSSTPLDWTKWLKKKVIFSLTDYSDRDAIIRALHAIEFNFDTYNLRFNFGIDNPDYPAKIKKSQYILDFDAYTNDILDKDEINTKLDEFHDKIQNLFESSITDDLRKKMK